MTLLTLTSASEGREPSLQASGEGEGTPKKEGKPGEEAVDYASTANASGGTLEPNAT